MCERERACIHVCMHMHVFLRVCMCLWLGFLIAQDNVTLLYSSFIFRILPFIFK